MTRTAQARVQAKAFVHVLAEETAGMPPGSWLMLDTIAQRLGITFDEARTIAADCVARQWIDVEAYSVRLREEGRVVAAKVRASIARPKGAA